MISRGLVTINDVVVTNPASRVEVGIDIVCLNGKPVRPVDKFVYIALNKPVGVVTTVRDEKGRPCVRDLIPVAERLFPVGRLDYDSQGLLLLTNDGELANRLMHPRFEVRKIYRVIIDRPLADSDREILKSGVQIRVGETVIPDAITVNKKGNSKELSVTLHTGKKREIRRMFQAAGYKVVELERIQFAGIKLGKLAAGEFRHLTETEIKKLKS